MKRILNLTLAACALSLASSVFAAKDNVPVSPETAITCGGSGEYSVMGRSLPESIDDTQCVAWSSYCAPCISSLEAQNCRLVDVAVNGPSLEGHAAAVTYLLSCVAP